VDGAGRVVALDAVGDPGETTTRPNAVVLMAGGVGRRLRPLTEALPKPMLRLGGRPILELIVEGLVEQGFGRIFLAVGYKADAIEAHFGTGEALGAEIRYLREDKPLGTAGALGLLPEPPTEPVIVMNGDLLTRVNFGHLLSFHDSREAAATMCVTDYVHRVPYGVVHSDGEHLVRVEEKPVQRFGVNAGVYVLSPEAVALVRAGEPCDMPDVFARVRDAQLTAVCFRIPDYWLDIGRLEDLERARGEFPEA